MPAAQRRRINRRTRLTLPRTKDDPGAATIFALLKYFLKLRIPSIAGSDHEITPNARRWNLWDMNYRSKSPNVAAEFDRSRCQFL